MRNLSLLIAGASVVISATAGEFPRFDYNVSRNADPIHRSSGLRPNANGELLFFNNAAMYKAAAPKKSHRIKRADQSNPDELYNITTLFSEDFSTFNGNDEVPTAINVTNEDGSIEGLPGWWGSDVYAGDKCAYVNCYKVYDEDYPDMFQVAGQINTPAIPTNGANNVQVKFRAKSVPYDDEESWEALNVILMCVSDEMPGIGRLVEFDWGSLSTEWDDEYWFNFDVPETFRYTDHETEESYTLPLTGVYVRFYSTGIPFYISDINVETRSAKVGIPQNLEFQKFSGNGYVAKWDAVEEADSYRVEVYNAEFNEETYGFDLTKAMDIETIVNEAQVNIDTAGLTYFNVTAYKGEQPSPTSESCPVFGVLPPVIAPISEIKDNSFTVSWTPANGATMTELWAYRQIMTNEPLEDYPFVSLDFSDAEYEYSGDALNLDKFAYGWMALPEAEIDEGIIKLDNYGALWGNPSAQLISVGGYDFSNLEGKAKIKIIARSEDGCGIVVATGGYSEEADSTVTMDAEAVEELSEELSEYVFELNANNSQTRFIIQVLGAGVVEIQSVVIETSFPEGVEIGWPYNDLYTEKSSIDIACPDNVEYSRVKVMGRSIKSIVAEIFGMDHTIMEAVSNFSEPVYAETSTSIINIDAENDIPVYYSIDGVIIGNHRPTNNGIYIKKKGAKTTKIAISK